MSSYIVEVGDEDVAIVVRDETAFRFFGVDPRVRALEGAYFRSPEAATRAAAHLIRGRAVGGAARRSGESRPVPADLSLAS